MVQVQKVRDSHVNQRLLNQEEQKVIENNYNNNNIQYEDVENINKMNKPQLLIALQILGVDNNGKHIL